MNDIRLRHDPSDPTHSTLVPAQPPSSRLCPEGWEPFAGVKIAGSHLLLLKKGSSIGVLSGIAVPYAVDLESEPLHAVAVAPGVLLVATAGGVVIVDIEPSSGRLSVRPDFNACLPAVRGVSAGNVYSTPRAVKVDVASVASARLTDAEARRLASSAVDALSAIESSSASAGVCCHPALACVRAYDANGMLLFATEPVVLSRPDGLQLPATIPFNASADSAYAEAEAVAAPVWQPVLEMPSALLAALPAGTVVEVLMSEPLDTLRMADAPEVSPRRRPADPLATVTFHPSRHDAAAVADAPMRVVWSSRRPSESQQIEVKGTGTAVSTAIGHDAPTILTAGSSAIASSVVVWGAPAMRRIAPPGAECYAVGCDDAAGPWHAYTAVDFADGSSQVTVSEGLSSPPAVFSPILSYPSADAIALTITVSSGTEVRTGRFPLVPCGQRGVWLHSSLRPFALPDAADAFVLPVASPRLKECPSFVAVAASSSPLAPFAMLSPADVDICAVAPAVASQSPWDFGRSRFYVFTTGGIYMLVADPRRHTASMSLIDTRIVASAHACCHVDGALAAIASGDIVLIAGGRVSRIARVPTTTALAWAHADHELWCITPSGVEVVCFDDAGRKYTIPEVFTPAPVQASIDTTYLSA